MKRLLAVSTCALAMFASVAVAGNALLGSYTVKINGATPAVVNGTWVVKVNPGGKYTIIQNGAVVIRGRYAMSGNKVTLGHESGPMACVGDQAPATYRWSIKAGMLTMKPIIERCLGREIILATKPLKKTG